MNDPPLGNYLEILKTHRCAGSIPQEDGETIELSSPQPVSKTSTRQTTEGSAKSLKMVEGRPAQRARMSIDAILYERWLNWQLRFLVLPTAS